MYLRAGSELKRLRRRRLFDCGTPELIVDSERDEMTNAFPVDLVRENEIGSTL